MSGNVAGLNEITEMASRSLNGVLTHLRKLATVQTSRGLSDGDLLQRFVSSSDAAAFTTLVERHGPMVLGVCRRALGNLHDAEDACQATFLVLSRKAARIRKSTSLSSWLHGVACRVATTLRRGLARRQRRERQIEAPPPKDAAAEVTWREMQVLLDVARDEEVELGRRRFAAAQVFADAADEVRVALRLCRGRVLDDRHSRVLSEARRRKRAADQGGQQAGAHDGAGPRTTTCRRRCCR